ncbi:hypothetical protein K503DRAFT_777150 [Rhizopogon vinicolor AM-OR11-026]|uniref:Uncharacterized protein n=1 Tax=Rhizopogon vinicolor AM-OR11-026 TaxID=1314800 RepID=A0A1B7MH82_9AGAM|nr:hypothetical protein K503DRAFT_777150 [Rhizopogon vinicolor AM-OR11-026]
MTRSQHFFTIATRIDAHAMQITGDIEFAWISFKMTPKHCALATETYNTCLKEKNHASRLETVTKGLLRKLGDIEVAVMNRVVKNDFKSRSGSETFWRRHCLAVELIKAEVEKTSSLQPFSLISTTTFLTPLSPRFTRPARVPAARQSCTPV